MFDNARRIIAKVYVNIDDTVYMCRAAGCTLGCPHMTHITLHTSACYMLDMTSGSW